MGHFNHGMFITPTQLGMVVLAAILIGAVIYILANKNIENDKEFALRNIRLSFEKGELSKERYEEAIKEIEKNL